MKFGVSKESPFLTTTTGAIAHPSTKVIFGDPSKRPRPFTSKVNSMIRKTLASSSNKINIKNLAKTDVGSNSPFSDFASASMPVDKQKLIKFYSSACSLKGLREKVAQGKIFTSPYLSSY